MSSRNALARPDSRAARWSGTALALMALGAALTLLYAGTAMDAVGTWGRSAAHAFSYLILPISGYFVWLRRAELATLTPRPSAAAGLLMLPAVLAWLLGELAQAAVLAQFGLVAVVQAGLLALLGWPIFRAFLLPLQLLWFLVPAGESLLPAMIQLTIVLTSLGLTALGLTVTVEGNILASEAGRFAVVEACSALDFMVGNTVISLVFASLMFNGLAKRTLYVLAGLPVAVLANNLRTTAVIYLTYQSGGELDLAADHETFGWVIFCVAVAAQMAVGWRLRDPPPPPRAAGEPGPPPAPGQVLAAAVVVLAPVLAAPAMAALLMTGNPPAAPLALCPPPALGPGVASDRHPPFPGADAMLSARYNGDGAPIDLVAAYFARIGPGREVAAWHNRLDLVGGWRHMAVTAATARLDAATTRVTEIWLRGPQRARQLAWRVYWVDGRLVAADWQAKLLRVASALRGDGGGMALIVSTSADDGWAAAAARLQAFLDRGPVLGPLVQAARSGAGC
jgi:EpsI family protein